MPRISFHALGYMSALQKTIGATFLLTRYEFAERVSETAVWSVLAGAQLKANLIPDAIGTHVS